MAENGNGVNGLPNWARVIALVGIPGAIALFLVWSLASFATAGVTELHRQMDAHAQVMNLHDSETQRTADKTMRLLLGICLNAAETQEQQRRCLE